MRRYKRDSEESAGECDLCHEFFEAMVFAESEGGASVCQPCVDQLAKQRTRPMLAQKAYCPECGAEAQCLLAVIISGENQEIRAFPGVVNINRPKTGFDPPRTVNVRFWCRHLHLFDVSFSFENAEPWIETRPVAVQGDWRPPSKIKDYWEYDADPAGE